MKKIIYFTFVFVALFPFVSQKAFAYETETHTYLTQEIVNFYNTHANNKISDDLKIFLIDGSRREDDAPRWMNHFYDPVKDRGLSYDPLIDPAANIGSWQKSKDWANDEINQDAARYKVPATIASILTAIQKMKLSEISTETNYTWNQALRYYLQGDKEKAMFLLGHVIHLLEDASVPDHVRNDAHPEGSLYETFTAKFTPSNNDSNLSNKLQNEHEIKLPSLSDYFYELATYANKNFYSKDTTGIQSGYNDPQPDYFSYLNDGKYYGMKVDENFGDFPLITAKKAIGFQSDFSIQNNFILQAYWNRLSVKTVDYGAGMIDLFFKEVEQKKNDTAFWQKKDESALAAFFNSFASGLTNLGGIARNFFFGNISLQGENNSLDIFDEEDTISTENNISQSHSDVPSSPSFFFTTSTITTTTTTVSTTSLLITTTSATTTNKIVFKKEEKIKNTSTTATSTSNSENNNESFSLWINEVMYDFPGSDENHEWMEIYHTGGDAVDLTSLSFLEGKTNHRIEFFQGSKLLSSGQFAIFAENPESFLRDNPGFLGNLFKVSMSLSNSGETLQVKNQKMTFDAFSYLDTLGAGGDGRTLQRFSDGWFASQPTPGRENVKSINAGGGGGQTETVKEDLEANFSFSPLIPKKGELISFSGSSSKGTIVKYEWDFGDGEQFIATSSALASHAYFSTGEKTVSLIVSDKENKKSSTTKIISIIPSITNIPAVSHMLISEVLPNSEGSDEGKEFVELYNPTTEPKNLDGWSLKYKTADGEESSLAAFKEGSDYVSVSPLSFLLVGLNNYDAANYNGRVANIHRAASLPNGTEVVQIILYNASDTIVDSIEYTSSSIEEGKSLERKALLDGACVSPSGDGEFLGNGCDTDAADDFQIRDIPLPQNSENLPEPREQLATPLPETGKTNIVFYTPMSAMLSFLWSPVSAPIGITPYYKIKQKGTDIYLTDIKTIATATDIGINEVGRNYNFEITVEDQEGFSSSPGFYEITIPSFIEAMYAYPDQRAGVIGKNNFELYYSQFPFIPGSGPWHGLAIYRNREANKENTVLRTEENFNLSDSTEAVSLAYTNCSYNQHIGTTAVFPLTMERCSASGGLSSSAMIFSAFEDLHLFLQTPVLDIPFSEGDYFTIAFYTFGGGGYGYQSLNFSVIDKTHYPLLSDRTNQHNPILQGTPTVSFDGSAKITLSLPTATDIDSIDSYISFETNYSPLSLGSLDTNLWTGAQTSMSVGMGDEYLIGVRAKDDFGNFSEVLTTTWTYPSTTILFAQTIEGSLSQIFGKKSHDYFPPNTTSMVLQSFSPEENISFDTILTKLSSNSYDSDATIRISVFPDSGNNAPLADSLLAESSVTLGKTDIPEEKTFFFSTPITLEKDKLYWFVFDVAGYADPAGYWTGNGWYLVASPDDVYPRGQLGFGVLSGTTHTIWGFENKDIYFRLGKRN